MNALRPTQHHMGRRAFTHDYSRPGIYHITIHVADGMGQPLGVVVGEEADKAHRDEQKARCLQEAAQGAVLVSPRIAPGEQEIMDAAMHNGFPVVIIADNGFPDRYHPSTERINSCAAGRLLLVTPWQYQYRGKNEQVTVPFCKTMNCVAQALCRTKDTWWKEAAPNDAVPSGFPAGTTPEQKRNNKTQDK